MGVLAPDIFSGFGSFSYSTFSVLILVIDLLFVVTTGLAVVGVVVLDDLMFIFRKLILLFRFFSSFVRLKNLFKFLREFSKALTIFKVLSVVVGTELVVVLAVVVGGKVVVVVVVGGDVRVVLDVELVVEVVVVEVVGDVGEVVGVVVVVLVVIVVVVAVISYCCKTGTT